MSRHAKGPRRYLRTPKGRTPTYVILDGQNEVSTGFGLGQEQEVDKALADYIGKKHTPHWRDGDPDHVLVADVMGYYVEEHAPELAHPELVGYHSLTLLKAWGTKPCSAITGDSCRQYVRDRVSGKLGRVVVPATARRELKTLQAAHNFAVKNSKLRFPPPIHMPPDAPRRECCLDRSEVARLVAGAMGFTPGFYSIATRQPVLDLKHWVRLHKPLYHVARFILIAFYTGTRHDAILRLRWGVNSDGGWFDLHHGKLYRKGEGERETSKRRPPAPIHHDLLRHLPRWRRLTVNGPVEYAGKLILRQKRGFNVARDRACLGREVTPHVLRHTCATMMLRAGLTVWEVAGYLGTSPKLIESTYGHHAPDHMMRAATSNLGRNLGTRTLREMQNAR